MNRCLLFALVVAFPSVNGLLADLADSSQKTTPRPLYHLPYPPGTAHLVSFGPGDAPHHKSPRNLHAYDFAMPYGTQVSAARSGVVVHAEGRNSGPTGRSRDNNFVAIRHADGSVAEYHHLMQDGVLVRAGEKIERGEVIGYSGASGRADGPHLHFVVVVEETSIPVRFVEGAKKGASIESSNIPKGLRDHYVARLKDLQSAKRLAAQGAPAVAAKLLGRDTRTQTVKTPNQRRAALALLPLENEVREFLRSIDESRNVSKPKVSAVVAPPEPTAPQQDSGGR